MHLFWRKEIFLEILPGKFCISFFGEKWYNAKRWYCLLTASLPAVFDDNLCDRIAQGLSDGYGGRACQAVTVLAVRQEMEARGPPFF